MLAKQVRLPNRVRHPPADGWSWMDRRSLREHGPRWSQEASLRYFVLAAASDKGGLLFYRDATLAGRLRITVAADRDRALNEVETGIAQGRLHRTFCR